jgi:hypothetical protein
MCNFQNGVPLTVLPAFLANEGRRFSLFEGCYEELGRLFLFPVDGSHKRKSPNQDLQDFWIDRIKLWLILKILFIL